jgi:hypothetical protein
MRAVPTLNFERAEGASVAPRPSALAKPNDLKPLQKLLFYLSSSRFPVSLRRYFELGCEVKGLGRGHVQRIKKQVKNGKS